MNLVDPETSLERFGFIHVPGALSADEVRVLRSIFDQRFRQIETDRNDSQRLIHSWQMYADDRLAKFTLKPRVLEAVSMACRGEVYMTPSMVLARNQVGLGKLKVFGVTLPNKEGWHVDSAADGKREYLVRDNYRMFKCGFYLQDNDEDYGGGVDVAPGCHRFPLQTEKIDTAFRLKTLRDIVAFSVFPRVMPLKAGDFLAFDYRLPHRSTIPKRLMHTMTEENRRTNYVPQLDEYRRKYVLYFDAGNAESAETFIQVMLREIRQRIASGNYGGRMNQAAAGHLLQSRPHLRAQFGTPSVRFSFFEPDIQRECFELLNVEQELRRN